MFCVFVTACEGNCKKALNPCKKLERFFSTGIFLTHGQLWAITIKWAASSLTPMMLITTFSHIGVIPEGHRETRNKVGSLSPAKHLVGCEPETQKPSNYDDNALTHQAPLPKFLKQNILVKQVNTCKYVCTQLIRLGFYNKEAQCASGYQSPRKHYPLFLAKPPFKSANCLSLLFNP